MSRILPQAGRGQRRGPGGCSPPAPARRGGGTKLAPREELNLARFPASSELRRWAPAGRGATIAAVHLSSRSPAPSSPPKPGRGVRPLQGQGGWGQHPRWAMPPASAECLPASRGQWGPHVCGAGGEGPLLGEGVLDWRDDCGAKWLLEQGWSLWGDGFSRGRWASQGDGL